MRADPATLLRIDQLAMGHPIQHGRTLAPRLGTDRAGRRPSRGGEVGVVGTFASVCHSVRPTDVEGLTGAGGDDAADPGVAGQLAGPFGRDRAGEVEVGRAGAGQQHLQIDLDIDVRAFPAGVG